MITSEYRQDFFFSLELDSFPLQITNSLFISCIRRLDTKMSIATKEQAIWESHPGQYLLNCQICSTGEIILPKLMLSANRIDSYIGHKVVFFLFEKTSCYIILVFGGERRGRDRVLLTESNVVLQRNQIHCQQI